MGTSPKNKKSSCLLTGTARASAQTKCRRRIKDIDKELRALDRNWQRVRLAGTGRPSFWVQIPPCPEGAEPIEYFMLYGRNYRLMNAKNFCAYIQDAFGPQPKDSLDWWNYSVAALENAILRHAESVGLLDDWKKTWARQRRDVAAG